MEERIGIDYSQVSFFFSLVVSPLQSGMMRPYLVWGT
jgi:hypothetical protein